MSTAPSNESTHSDFLQLEPATPQKVETETPVVEDRWDIDKELRSLLEMAGNSCSPNHQELTVESQQLTQSIASVKSELADLQRSNQEQFQSIERGVNKSEQLQQRTEQLAKYSKLQVRQMQEMLQSFDSVRQSIIAALDKFGDYQQLEPMLQKILAADLSLRQANEKLQVHQADLYDSLQSIHKQVELRSSAAEQNLLQGQAEFERLLETIRADRERTIDLQNLVTQNFQESQQLHVSLTSLQKGLSGNSEQLQQDFTALAESVQHEKQQFYQLTADTINKTDAMRSQFAEIAKQVSKDWESIQSLQFRVDDLRDYFDAEGKQPVNQLNQRYDELVSSWSDIKKKNVTIEKLQQSQQTWLRILSGAWVVTILLAIGAVMKFAR
jgi:DNA repair exonuclease SbcCD ATPase subunit